jgi:hypothetical protein
MNALARAEITATLYIQKKYWLRIGHAYTFLCKLASREAVAVRFTHGLKKYWCPLSNYASGS